MVKKKNAIAWEDYKKDNLTKEQIAELKLRTDIASEKIKKSNAKYTAIFRKEDIGYSVTFPALDGCITEGDSKEEAIKNASEALALFINTNIRINLNYKFPTDTADPDYVQHEGDFMQLIEYKEFMDEGLFILG